MTTTRLPYSKCPVCLDAATGVSPTGDPDPGKPEKGDATVCIYCGSLLLFGPGLVLHKATVAQMEDMAQAQPRAFRTLIEVKKAIDSKPWLQKRK